MYFVLTPPDFGIMSALAAFNLHTCERFLAIGHVELAYLRRSVTRWALKIEVYTGRTNNVRPS